MIVPEIGHEWSWGSPPCKQASQRTEPVTRTVDSLSSPYPAICLQSSRLKRSDTGVSPSADSTTTGNPWPSRRKKKKKLNQNGLTESWNLQNLVIIFLLCLWGAELYQYDHTNQSTPFERQIISLYNASHRRWLVVSPYAEFTEIPFLDLTLTYMLKWGFQPLIFRSMIYNLIN